MKLSCRPLAFPSYQATLENKQSSGISLPAPIFCIIFEEKCFLCYIILINQASLSGCLYLVRYWVMCLLKLFLICESGCDVMNFEVGPIFLIKLFFLHDQKVMTKT